MSTGTAKEMMISSELSRAETSRAQGAVLADQKRSSNVATNLAKQRLACHKQSAAPHGDVFGRDSPGDVRPNVPFTVPPIEFSGLFGLLAHVVAKSEIPKVS